MSTYLFQAEDWVYIADSMGRLGQGYYKNRNNPSKTITPSEFESRRSQPATIASNKKEQNINKINEPSTASPSNGLLASSESGSVELTPWDNPIVGEETASTSTQNAVTQKKMPAAPQTQSKQAKTKKQSSQGGESGNSQGAFSNHENIGTETPNGPDGGEGSGSAKVICTELVRQGYMRPSERRACIVYALARLPNSFMIGYQFWAVPYVRLMRKSKLATNLIAPFTLWRAQEVCHRMGLRKSGSLPGKIICALHDSLCCLIGHFVQKRDYSTLYKQETSL